MEEYLKTDLINERQNQSIMNILWPLFIVFSGLMYALMKGRGEGIGWEALVWIIVIFFSVKNTKNNNKRLKELKKEKLVFDGNTIQCYEKGRLFTFNSENIPIGIKVSKSEVEILTIENKILLVNLDEYTSLEYTQLKIRKQFRNYMETNNISDFNIQK